MDLTAAEIPPNDTPAAEGEARFRDSLYRWWQFILLYNIYLKDAGTSDFNKQMSLKKCDAAKIQNPKSLLRGYAYVTKLGSVQYLLASN